MFNMPTCFAFMGLILGSSSLIIKQVNIKQNLLLHICYFILSLVISIFLFLIEAKSNRTVKHITLHTILF